MRRLTSWVLAILAVFSLAAPAFAHNMAEHNRIIERILFGNEEYIKTLTKGSEEYSALTALEYAVAICLDQYNGNYTDQLNALNRRGIHDIPKSIDEIDFKANEYHRRYTHRGWDQDYSGFDKAHWSIRKTLLLQTVNDVFGFKRFAGKWLVFDFGYDDQCEAFAEFLYYLHVLGDYDDAKEKKVIVGCVMPLAREHPGEQNRDIFWELEQILPVLFKSSTKDVAFTGLVQDIKILAEEARQLGDLTTENFEQYREIANALMQKLESKVPFLLSKEAFFSNIF